MQRGPAMMQSVASNRRLGMPLRQPVIRDHCTRRTPPNGGGMLIVHGTVQYCSYRYRVQPSSSTRRCRRYRCRPVSDSQATSSETVAHRSASLALECHRRAISSSVVVAYNNCMPLLNTSRIAALKSTDDVVKMHAMPLEQKWGDVIVEGKPQFTRYC